MNLTNEERRQLERKSVWNAKIGVIYIASSLSLEREWHMALPDEVSFHVARISIDDDSATKEDIWRMVNSSEVERLSKQLASCEVDVIVFGCTAGSFLGGPGWDETLAKRISDAAGGIPATTTSSGLLEALRAIGCKKINMATPYQDNVTVDEKKFIESIGVSVLSFTGEQCSKDIEIVKVTPERYAQALLDLYEKSPEAEGAFISCTNSRTIELIELMEERLGTIILSSNQVSLFAALKKIGYKGPVYGYGSLFKYL